MKHTLFHINLLVVITSFIVNACVPATMAVTLLPHSAKGYELYSWQENNQWHFTLITGTNRLKSLGEIISGEDIVREDGLVKISVQGLDAIQNTLSRLPQHEEIIWANSLEPADTQTALIQMPPDKMINIIQEHCKQFGLNLVISK
jgi:hypothetical protein